MRAKTVVSNKPCKRGHFVRYEKGGGCIECIKVNLVEFRKRNGLYRGRRRTDEDIKLTLVELLTGQLNKQKERWGFI